MCDTRSPAGRLVCSRTTPHERGHVYVHPSSAPDAKASADEHCEDVER